MGAKHGSPGKRLVNFLLDGGGTRTIGEIARRSADGKLLAKARPELEGLIVEETSRSARSKRPVKRVLLTMKGWGAAAAFRPGFVPARLATPILKAWFEDLQREGDKWALGFQKTIDRLTEQAAEYERLKAAGMVYPSPLLRKRRKDFQKPNSGAFKPTMKPPAKVGAFGSPAASIAEAPRAFLSPTFEVPGTPVESKTIPPPVVRNHALVAAQKASSRLTQFAKPAGAPDDYCDWCEEPDGTPLPPPPFHNCENHRAKRLSWQPRRVASKSAPTMPTASSDNPTESLVDRIRKAPGFGNISVRNGQVLYGNERFVSPEEWCRLMPHVKV